MIDDIQQDAIRDMAKAIDALKNNFSKIKTGRAHPSLLDQIKVAYCGVETPLSQVASVNIENSRTLIVTPWDKPMIDAIQKAIQVSSLDLNPSTTGTVIRISLPLLTEERRRNLVKQVKEEAENSRISIRTIRRGINSKIKKALQKKIISKDAAHEKEEAIQKLTDEFIQKIEKQIKSKEADLLSV